MQESAFCRSRGKAILIQGKLPPLVMQAALVANSALPTRRAAISLASLTSTKTGPSTTTPRQRTRCHRILSKVRISTPVIMAGHEIQMVDDFGKLLEEMLAKAREVKQTRTVDPPLNKSDLTNLFTQIDSVFPSSISNESKKHAIETAARDTFNNLLVSHAQDEHSENLFI